MMNLLRSFASLLLLVAAVGSSHAQDVAGKPTDLPAKEKFHLFLLVGQSNMAGRGTVEPSDQTPHPRVLMLDRRGNWVPAVDPMHWDKTSAGVGLGRTFGIAVAEADPSITVGLIPCAHGGSPIDSWKPGVYYAPTKGHPWDDAMTRAKQAMEKGTLKAILWHQGESDAKEELVAAYPAKLADLVGRFRKELAAPEAPFLLGGIGKFDDVPWNDFQRRIDAAHRGLPERVSRAAFVSSEGLKHKGDQVHFDAAGYREFGRRYAAAYLKQFASNPGK